MLRRNDDLDGTPAFPNAGGKGGQVLRRSLVFNGGKRPGAPYHQQLAFFPQLSAEHASGEPTARANSVDDVPIVAQRIKRLPSIRSKLERLPGMSLARMQDLGGCRAIVSDIDRVAELVDYYRDKSRMKHRLVREDPYVWRPPKSGYRSVHLVYAYNGDTATYNGLQIELQLRSKLQHGWATAVETVETFTGQALKSSVGEQEWLRFFALMSSALAFREGTPTVPGTPDDPKVLVRELRESADNLQVIGRLRGFGAALAHTEENFEPKKNQTFLLQLDLREQILRVSTYDSPAEDHDSTAD